MRAGALSVIALLLFFMLAGGQARHPIPPGIRQADRLPEPGDIVPPLKTPKRQPVDPAKIQREADELATLAQLIPSEIQQTESGRLPKDLGEQLKRIEKLSKQLRRAVSP